MIALVAFASLTLPLLSAAQLVPTGPGPNDVFKQGGACTISWTPDTTGKWKSTFIELMTGPNQPMIHLATVAAVDGTDPTKASISIPCPGVTPNSAIYFYQFTAQGQNTTWTGRFAISDPSGATTPPPNAKQPDGESIPWGAGKLLDASQGSPPPPTAPPGQVDGSTGASSSPNGTSPPPVFTASAPSTGPSAPPTSAPSSASISSAVSAAPASPPTKTTVVVIPATTSAPPSTSSASNGGGSSNGAMINSFSAATAFSAAVLLGSMTLC